VELTTADKQTDVGVIPSDWEVTTVGQEFEVQLGKMLDAARSRGVPKPYLGNRAVQWDRIDASDLPTVPLTRDEQEKFRLCKGDILVCEGGEVGRAAIWNAPIPECYYQKALHRLRPLNGYEPKLLIGVLRYLSERGRLANYVTQTSIAHLPREKLLTLPIPRPPGSEQRAIAGVLTDLDALLDGLTRLLAKKSDLKQAAMQQLLTGRTRLPGFGGAWMTRRLAGLCSLKSGEGITSVDINDSGVYPCYGGNGLRGYTSRFTHDGSFALIGRQGALCGNVVGVEGKFFASEHAVVVTASADVDIRWLTYALATMNLNQFSESSAQPGLSVSKIQLLDLSVPPTKTEQSAIATVLSDMDAGLAALEARHAKTQALKQAMMQALLTGRIRLASPEPAHA
jgi:type I restriction enzyme S subunit